MTPIFREICLLPGFEKDVKRLEKRYPTLSADIDTFIDTGLRLFHKLGNDNGGIVRLAGLGIQAPKVYKVRKFACRALKGTGSRSGMRIIYSYDETQDTIVFIEMYFKGSKENEDRKRILDFLKSLT